MNLPRLHLVTDAGVVAEPGFRALAWRLLEQCGPRLALHLRVPGGAGATVHALAAALRPVALATGARFLVNDRVDIAMAVRADGVQLGSRSLPVEAVRPLVGHAWIGVSVHAVAGAVDAAAGGTDFVILGTIHASASHAGRRPLGEAALAHAAQRTRIPVLGIGGMTPERSAAARAAGAYGAAVLGGIWRAADPERAAADYLEALDERG